MTQQNYVKKTLEEFGELAGKYNVGGKAKLVLKFFLKSALEGQIEGVREEVKKAEMKVDAEVYIDAALAAEVAPFDRGVDLGFERFRTQVLSLLDLT